MGIVKTLVCSGVLVGWLALMTGSVRIDAADAPVRALINAHAHNDYEHARPLFDALDHGFCSVEADIYLANGRLLVAHDANKVKSERTLEALYLDPLRERIRKNGGRLFPGGPPASLLIDVKSEAESTYGALREVLKKYADILTVYDHGKVITNAVTVVVSGERAKLMMIAEPVRYAGMDGRLADLDGNDPASLIPWMSDNWTKIFKWRGGGPMPAEEREKLKGIVQKAHLQGRRVRFWATPDRPEFWRELKAAQVDVFNADDLGGLRAFLVGEGN